MVAITYEMIHDTRIIYTDGRRTWRGAIRGYFGDSNGRWDGDTLVVDVTNFSAQDQLPRLARHAAPGRALHAQSAAPCATRYGRRPAHLDAPWTAALELAPQPEAMFEYACHEGNNSMRNILSGARATER